MTDRPPRLHSDPVDAGGHAAAVSTRRVADSLREQQAEIVRAVRGEVGAWHYSLAAEYAGALASALEMFAERALASMSPGALYAVLSPPRIAEAAWAEASEDATLANWFGAAGIPDAGRREHYRTISDALAVLITSLGLMEYDLRKNDDESAAEIAASLMMEAEDARFLADSLAAFNGTQVALLRLFGAATPWRVTLKAIELAVSLLLIPGVLWGLSDVAYGNNMWFVGAPLRFGAWIWFGSVILLALRTWRNNDHVGNRQSAVVPMTSERHIR